MLGFSLAIRDIYFTFSSYMGKFNYTGCYTDEFRKGTISFIGDNRFNRWLGTG